MEPVTLRRYLDQPSEARAWLASWGFQAVDRAHANLLRIAGLHIPLDVLCQLADQLQAMLPASADPDMAFNNLERFLSASVNPLSTATLFERDRQALPILLQIFAASQYFSDLLIADSGAFELLRVTEGQGVSRESLVQELWTEVLAISTTTGVSSALRRFKRREMLRIGYGDIVKNQRLEIVTAQISRLAEALVEVAVRAARLQLEQKFGSPKTAEKRTSRYVVLGLGKLGGEELNYSSDIDLVCFYEGEGSTSGLRKISNTEFFERLTKDVVKLLSEVTEFGQAYRVDLRLRPDGARGPLASTAESAWHYYDLAGRTWERQAFVKARPVAGDLSLGEEFLGRLEPWIYRKYLGLADITGIKALKRRIEKRSEIEHGDRLDVKAGQGGIRDVEFAIQFLQLLNGGDLPELRTGNTLTALARLEEVGCLTDQERALLEGNYRLLRKIEHRLQFMFDLQTHSIPPSELEQQRLALRLGYVGGEGEAGGPPKTARDRLLEDYQQATSLNRQILNHLLHEAFPDAPDMDPECDLVLDPDPSSERIREVLGKYPFRDPLSAFRHLQQLADEQVKFLSPRRCRLFLASIAQRLLQAIAETPDPDQTLVNLEKVSASLGGKAVLWELLRFNPPSLRLYVDVCCYGPTLAELLITNPGMLDELMDSLVFNKLPTREELEQELSELCRNAEDLDPILHSFKHSHWLRVGVRDLLGKETVETTSAFLTDLAETILHQVLQTEMKKLVARYGQPTIAAGPRAGEPCGFVLTALGKFGGRELSYPSDLDVVFLYEADGRTVQPRRSRAKETTFNQHFFSELGQRLIKVVGQMGPQGRLYEVDTRLRPTGRSGALVTSLAGFEQYFAEGQGQLWERQAFCKARVLFASPELERQALAVLQSCSYDHVWRVEDAESIRGMRRRMEESAAGFNLKRGPGGLSDVEFLVQMLQLQHGGEQPALRLPNTMEALEALHQAGWIESDHFHWFRESYRELRRIESRLRLQIPTARDELPTDPKELGKLARQLGYGSGADLLAKYRETTSQNRRRFDLLTSAAAAASPARL